MVAGEHTFYETDTFEMFKGKKLGRDRIIGMTAGGPHLPSR